MKNIFKNNFFRFLLFLLFLFICFYLGETLRFDAHAFKEIFSETPVIASGIVFILLYVVLTFFVWFGPKDVLRVSAAFIFGAYISTFFVLISEMINVFLLFHFSRKLGQGFVKEKFNLDDSGIEKAKKNKGFIGTLALRLNPLIPFRFMDLGAGLSTVSFKKYFTACLLGSPLRIFWLQYILATLGENMKYWTEILMNALRNNSPENYNKVFNFMSDYPGIIMISFLYFVSFILISIIAIIIKMLSIKRKKKG